MISVRERNIISELQFQFSKSAGPGGQHVNKTESKVELRFHVETSDLLSEDEKEQLISKLANRMNQDGWIVLSCQQTRSQIKNKEIVIEKFFVLLEKAMQKRKSRIPTKPSKAAVEKRIEKKKKTARLKELRKNITPE